MTKSQKHSQAYRKLEQLLKGRFGEFAHKVTSIQPWGDTAIVVVDREENEANSIPISPITPPRSVLDDEALEEIARNWPEAGIDIPPRSE